MGYFLSIVTMVCIWLVCIKGTLLLTGLTGLFSLGQAAIMLIGAYIVGLLYVRVGLPILVASILAVLITGVIAYLMSLVALRVRQDHFAIATLGFGEAARAMVIHWRDYTGGALGFRGMPLSLEWWMALLILAAVVCLVALLKRSDFGRRCRAVRDNELAAEVLGINVYRHKTYVFVISAMIVAVGGAMTAFYQGFLHPEMGNWLITAQWIIIVFVGGRNSITGTLVVGAILVSMPELLRFVDEWRTIIYSVVVILMISFRPEGLFGKREFSVRGIISTVKRTLRGGPLAGRGDVGNA